jgi:Amt family ammonium transporter
MLIKRMKRKEIGSHNLILTTIGCIFVWVGWFSFNAGSALKANWQAGRA